MFLLTQFTIKLNCCSTLAMICNLFQLTRKTFIMQWLSAFLLADNCQRQYNYILRAKYKKKLESQSCFSWPLSLKKKKNLKVNILMLIHFFENAMSLPDIGNHGSPEILFLLISANCVLPWLFLGKIVLSQMG